MTRRIAIYVVLIAAIIMLLAASAIGWLQSTVERPFTLSDEKSIVIEKGASKTHILNKLVSMQLIESNLPGRLYIKLFRQGDLIKTGTYAIEPGDSLQSLLDKFYQGDEKQFAVSLIEGLTLQQWLETLAAEPQLSANDLPVLQHVAMLLANELPGKTLEGWLMPDTYFFTAGTEAENILIRAYESMQAYLQSAWQERQQGLPYDSAYDALIMASIIEKETGLASERAQIGGVFINRLRKNMRLQTDPTVIYGLGERFDGNLTRAHLREATPYNTYVIKGLPPTPIAMPGKAAIDAALHPLDTEALYFVSRGDGSHYFSRTLDEHNQAVRKYQLNQ
ncbi:endolytic transglycosylase MltG [Aestuariibacter salexigens]|uniref:endolytic transglycosylase MltG n=1 Tax=Aestuariibacter salexigens TaxID=226010 RepID=UPI00040E7A3D|nr:endolytic transglycosylase MltG [Aestuariibacter salexigens]